MGGALPPSVTSAAATAVAAPATPAPATAEATVVRLPERLPEVTRPVVLTGTVAGQTPEGLTRVRTSAGELLLDSKTQLPPDKPVTIQITPGQTTPGTGTPSSTTPAPTTPGTIPAKPTALILLQALGNPTGAAGGTAAATTPAGSPATGNAATPAVLLPTTPTPTTAPTLPPLLPGTVVPALVIAGGSGAKPMPAAPAGGAAPQPTAPSPAGSNPAGPAKPEAAAPATPSMPAPPTAGGSATFGTPVQLGGDAAHPGAGAPATPDRSAGTAGGTSAELPELPRGATVALKILTVTPPPQQPRPPGDPESGGRTGQGGGQTASQPGNQAGSQPSLDAEAPTLPPDTPVLRGTVAGSTPQGQPILATKQGMLALNVPASLPPGAKVTAALADLAQATQAAAPTLPGPPGPVDERDWPAMRQLMATLAASDPALARSMLATMPQPNRKLTAALGFFLAAMRGGDARGWLGDDASSALDKAGRRDLLERLDKDFEGLRREAAEALPGDWRSYTIPLMDSTGPKPIKLHVHPLKEDEEGDGRPRGKPGSRFLIDLDLSRFGPMQLDGLVRPNHFDLILRSHAALPPELRVELIQVFADSVRAVGYSGGLSFQSGARSWVKLTRAGQAGLGVSA